MGIAALFLFLIMPVLAAVLACLCAGLVAVWMALRRTETQTATLLMLAAHLAEPAFSTGWVLLWALNAKAPPGWPPSVTAALGSITLALLALPVLGLASSHAIHRKQAGMLLGLGLVRGCLYAGTYYGGFARGNAGPLFLSVLGLAMALWASATVGVLQLTASRERPPRPAHGVVRPVEEIVIEARPGSARSGRSSSSGRPPRSRESWSSPPSAAPSRSSGFWSTPRSWSAPGR